jgi:patatin-like phospholipase/acyl hydrolase
MARSRTKRTAAAGPKFTRILSIDGGGIRGIIPGQILVTLEQKLQETDANAHIADYFDLIVGTSTGGILACLYLAPEAAEGVLASKPRFSAAEAVDLYLERGDDVFDISLWHRIRTAGGVTDEKYPADGLEELLVDYLDELKLSHLLKPCLITAYDIRRRRAHFFRQHRAVKSRGYDFLVRDVARATSAAPTYFEVARAKSLSNVAYPLVDGGVFANNPALCAYAEARNLPSQPKAKDMVIFSLGTGTVKKAYEYKIAKDWGLVQWIKPVLEIMMSGVAETVDYQLGQIFDAVGKRRQYVRIDAELGDASPDMDDVSMDNLQALREAGQYAAERHAGELNALVDLLRA